jgi:hypothetical protein
MGEHGWCLKRPNGKLVPETFSDDKEEAWSNAYNYLCDKSWMKKYWKDWDGSVEAAKKRGWIIVPVWLVEFGAE